MDTEPETENNGWHILWSLGPAVDEVWWRRGKEEGYKENTLKKAINIQCLVSSKFRTYAHEAGLRCGPTRHVGAYARHARRAHYYAAAIVNLVEIQGTYENTAGI